MQRSYAEGLIWLSCCTTSRLSPLVPPQAKPPADGPVSGTCLVPAPLGQPRALANLSVLRRVRNLSVLVLIRHEARIRSKKEEFSCGVRCNTSCSWPSEGRPSSIKGWLRLQNWDLSLGSDFIPCPSPEKQRMLELRVSSPGQVKPHIHPRG